MSIQLQNRFKFCPPGFIVDESRYCEPETSALVPCVDSTEGSKNITSKESKESETWPEGNNAFFTFKQLFSRGQLSYLVYENDIYGFKIEYPHGV